MFAALTYTKTRIPLPAEVVGVNAGVCSNVEVDEETGERLVFCCLDELYQMREEGLESEMEELLTKLEGTQKMTPEEALALFEGPYESTLHTKYDWKTFCGEQIACEKCAIAPLCGNNVKQEGEECDEGENNSDTAPDSCRTTCTLPRCGDAIIDSGEECDTGDNNSDTTSDHCRTSCKLPSCGDGIEDVQEMCDDGNLANGDGCSASCSIETAGAQQSSASPIQNSSTAASSSTASPLSSSVSSEANLEPIQSSSSSEVLPSSTVASSEDQISSTATSKPYISQPSIPTSSIKKPELIEQPNEPSHQAPPVQFAFAGNGILEPGEECDDGNDNNEDGCRDGAIENNVVCGNKNIEGDEECEGEGDSCKECKLVTGTHTTCGDGVLTPREQCDDENIESGDGCSSNCKKESSIVTGVFYNANKAVEDGEECDDGNHNDGDGCSATGFFENGKAGDGILQRALGEECEPSLHDASLPFRCNEDGKFVLESCGNGTLEAGEYCDLGNANSATAGSLCRTSCRYAGCGDAILDPTEECDDGNLVSHDSCDRFCMVTSGRTRSSVARSMSSKAAVPVRVQETGTIAKTGPAALVAIVVGSAGGIAWMRKRKR